MRYSLYNKVTRRFEKKELNDMGMGIGYDVMTAEYYLHNSKEVFARIPAEYIAVWCKEQDFDDWFIGEYDSDYTIMPDYVRLFFAQMVFGNLVLDDMTDAYVVRKALRKWVSDSPQN